METLGTRIQCLREARGWSAEELAREAQVQPKYLAKWEADQVAQYDIPMLQRIAAALATTPDGLLPPGTTTGARILRHRLARGWTAKEFAARVGLNSGSLPRMERDQQELRGDTLQRMAAAFGVAVADLVGGDAAALVERVRQGDPPRGRDATRALARALGLRIRDLAALSVDADPFLIGAPAQRRDAEWFAALWRAHRFTTGVHLRAIHYVILSRGAALPDGRAYENRMSHFEILNGASKYARLLELVDPTAFEDHRNGTGAMFVYTRDVPPEPEWSVGEMPWWHLPWIDPNMASSEPFGLPSTSVEGYDYLAADQPYRLEVWIEKSTQDRLLAPICHTYGADLVTSIGFQSITNVVRLLQRIGRLGKPVRVFYISDFDPAGDAMPVAVARQIEYWRDRYAPGVDIKLQPIALTAEQVAAYNLPKIPLKDTDQRAGNFEDRHGEGAVELDALEALYPGTLAQLVEQALAPYVDPTLSDRLDVAEADALRLTHATMHASVAMPTSDARAQLAADIEQVAQRYRARLTELSKAITLDLLPISKRMDALRAHIGETIRQIKIALPDRPEPEIDEPDEDDWLFDASRPYLDQLAVYKARKDGSTPDDGSDDDTDDEVA